MTAASPVDQQASVSRMIPAGVCKCGCGRVTRIVKKNDTSRGLTKGAPRDFVHGHNALKHGQSRKTAKAGGGRRMELHRLIAERVLGKPLPHRADVHHADGNYLNNENRNLVVCEDRAYHRLLHMRTNVLRAGGNPNTDLFCHSCKHAKNAAEFKGRKQKSNGKASRCRSCVNAARRAARQSVAVEGRR